MLFLGRLYTQDGIIPFSQFYCIQLCIIFRFSFAFSISFVLNDKSTSGKIDILLLFDKPYHSMLLCAFTHSYFVANFLKGYEQKTMMLSIVLTIVNNNHYMLHEIFYNWEQSDNRVVSEEDLTFTICDNENINYSQSDWNKWHNDFSSEIYRTSLSIFERMQYWS